MSLLFVYGSLRQGAEEHTQMAGATFLGEVATLPKYTLKRVLDFEGLVNGSQAVTGDLYEVTPEKLLQLDDWEYTIFRREAIQLANGRIADAYKLQEKFLQCLANETPIAARVARRFLADTIGDPEDLVKRFEDALEKLSDLEKDLPWMQEAQEAFEEAAKEPKLYPSETVDDVIQRQGDRRIISLVWNWKTDLIKYVMAVRTGYVKLWHAGGGKLFLAILQQYELPPKTRKSIEAGAKFYTKSQSKAPKKLLALAAYEKMLASNRGFLAAAKEALRIGKPRIETQESEKLRAGPFTLINTGGFDDKTMSTVQSVVSTAARLLAAKGLNRVLYGDVLVSRTLSAPRVLAFYLTDKDEMFVRANLRKNRDSVQTLCHELAHRLHFKFLSGKNNEIKRIYNTLASKAGDRRREKINEVLETHPILPGDKYVEKGATWEVTGTDWDGRKLVVNLGRKLEDPETGKVLPLKARIGLEGYLYNKGLLTNEDLTGFVTPYAGKNYEENFAEMIAYWCLDKLPEDQVEMLKTVL